MKDTEINTLIGSRIKAAREESGMSQAELARVIGYESATAISLIEAGERKIKAEDLKQISAVTHRPYSYFLGLEDKSTDIKVALRADKDLSDEDKKAVMHFIELAKKRNGK